MEKMTRSIALGFVIYNPEDSFLSRVQMMIKSGFDVYVFDNSPERRRLESFADGEGKIKYLTCGKNHGLGLGISSVCAQAYYENHSALVFFDQDTIFNEETLSFIEKFYVGLPELGGTHSVVVFNASRYGRDQEWDCFKDVPLAINSGSLFYLNNLKILNWHNESYFVDGVDYEFCLRSSLRGFRIGEYSCTPGFDHSTEQPDQKYHIFGKKYSMREYSFSRILDVSISSLRLVFSALIGWAIRFAFKIARLWIIYLAVQMLVRLLNLIDKYKYMK